MLPALDDTGATAQDMVDGARTLKSPRGLMEAGLDPLVTLNLDGRITDANEAMIKATGVPRETLLEFDFSSCFTEPELARDGYLRAFAKGSVTDYPLTVRHSDGHLTEVMYNMSVYNDGDVPRVFAAARDITETKRIAREFTNTRNLLDTILQRSVDHSVIGEDLNHTIIAWNDGAERNYGYTARDILGRNSDVLHTPEGMASGAVEALFQTVGAIGFADGEFERTRQDGTRFWACVVVTRRDDAAGDPIGYLLMSSDISAKKEQALATSRYARGLIEVSLDALMLINPLGKIIDVNEATIKLTGMARDELIGTDFSLCFTEPEQARAGYQLVYANGSITDYPLTIRNRDKTLTDVLYNASIFTDASGGVGGVLASARDMTAKKRAEMEIAGQRYKELERLAELERFQKLTVGRELKMIELKKEILELKKGLIKSGTG